MHVFSFFPTNHRGVRYQEVNFAQNVHAVLKKVSATTNVRYIEVFQ